MAVDTYKRSDFIINVGGIVNSCHNQNSNNTVAIITPFYVYAKKP